MDGQASNVRTENRLPDLAASRSRGTTLTENSVSGGTGRGAEACSWNGGRGIRDTEDRQIFYEIMLQRAGVRRE